MLCILRVMWTDSISLDKLMEENCYKLDKLSKKKKWTLNDYIKNSTEHALKAVSDEELLKVNESKSEYHKKELKNRLERWQSKPLYGQYLQDNKDKTDNDITWSWLKNGELKKETEGFLIAAQDQALRTNAVKTNIDLVTEDSKCRLMLGRQSMWEMFVWKNMFWGFF